MWIRAIIIGLAVLTTIVGAASARDHTFSNGMLSDDQFYAAISCKAKLDNRCQEKPTRWPGEIVAWACDGRIVRLCMRVFGL